MALEECKSLTCDEGLAKTLEMLEKAQAALKTKEAEVRRLTEQNVEVLAGTIQEQKGPAVEGSVWGVGVGGLE